MYKKYVHKFYVLFYLFRFILKHSIFLACFVFFFVRTRRAFWLCLYFYQLTTVSCHKITTLFDQKKILSHNRIRNDHYFQRTHFFHKNIQFMQAQSSISSEPKLKTIRNCLSYLYVYKIYIVTPLHCVRSLLRTEKNTFRSMQLIFYH